jgi:competence protein ComEC
MDHGRIVDNLPRSIWRAPMVPAALVVTAGVLIDRYFRIPLKVSLAAGAAALLAYLATQFKKTNRLGLVYLGLAGAAFGMAYHNYRRDVYASDDIGRLAPVEPRPIRVRAILDEEPRRVPGVPDDPLRSRPRGEYASAIIRTTQLHSMGGWQPISGRVRWLAEGDLPAVHIGDEIEIVGRLVQIPRPSNPGEFDLAAYWQDQGILAQISSRQAPGVVNQLNRGWQTSPAGWLAVARGWGQNVLLKYLPQQTGGVAGALLLGEGAPMTQDDWEKYVRTGVIHVLAISGQHLVILAGFMWFAMPRFGLSLRKSALLVAGLMFLYALLTGGRPPAMRAAIMVGAACFALALPRRTLPANLFAMAWLGVLLIKPTDVDDMGCLLSFLAVAVLMWGTHNLFRTKSDPLEALVEASRTPWERRFRRVGWFLAEAYLVTAIVWVALAPLLAYRTHAIPMAGLLLGPPLTLLTAIALLFGFLLLFLAVLVPPLAFVPALAVNFCLMACEWLVDRADGWRIQVYVPDVPSWWIWTFYFGFLAALTQGPLRSRWWWCLAVGLGWLCLGLLAGAAKPRPDGMIVTFLAVGHGGCTVIETPDGRTLLYDAGAISGPDVSARRIAPFLWSRGIRRIDDIFLSHGDLDHFNGIPDLLDRFSVGRICLTPSFEKKRNRPIQHTMQELERRGVRLHILKAGDRLGAGAVSIEVLHPPATGPPGPENVRSMTLRIEHLGHSFLLTGDLEGEGLAQVVKLPGRDVDVLMAPHHGSHRVDGAALAAWCKPKMVVSCQGPPRGKAKAKEIYQADGALFWSTYGQGAITFRSRKGELVAETFLTRNRLSLP